MSAGCRLFTWGFDIEVFLCVLGPYVSFTGICLSFGIRFNDLNHNNPSKYETAEDLSSAVSPIRYNSRKFGKYL
jgi:hypothetical protein